MQTILGAGGIIGKHLALELHQMQIPVRLVGRKPRKINDSDELFTADLLEPTRVSEAVRGSEVAYLTAGLPYKTAIWQQQWPVVMRNVITACKLHRCKLVFFDNVYLYGKVDGTMKEDLPAKPSSEKGKVRAQIAQMLMDEIKSGELEVLIVRSADFYGPETPLSFINVMVFDNLIKNKRPQWMVSDKFKHSLTYTPDAGKATAWLGNAADAYGQVWHAPTASNPLTGKEFMELGIREFHTRVEPQVVSRWMIRMIGLFVPVLKESVEMLYQFDRDYIFDSSKFNKRFPDFKTTSYENGVKEIFDDYRSKIEKELAASTR
ncbi:MAG: NAD-dependent epimerase/dehydratase family protein [Flavobacteriales bacterium]